MANKVRYGKCGSGIIIPRKDEDEMMNIHAEHWMAVSQSSGLKSQQAWSFSGFLFATR